MRNLISISITAIILLSCPAVAGIDNSLFAADEPDAAIQYRQNYFPNLRSIEELKTLFNKDYGKIRLVLLMSPS